MPAADDDIAYCHACGTAMDVSKVAPFSNVECPVCLKHTRVKREFGPYTLLRRHAIGGMSMVFVGQDNTLDREVALKILSEDFSADEKRIASFEEEAQITAAISHPHVVRVFKTGKAFGRFYIAMELVPGGHLEHQIKERGSLPEIEALKLALEVADGLRAAHAAGLIHRDIKPGNILLDSAGSAKIVDFGLALMTKGGVAKPDELWATPYYVPPETIEGLEEDYRADIYAFGATFYHVLAGKPPCTEESMDTTQLREAKRNVIPLGAACPKLNMETAAVIENAMAYDPKSRFSSYDDLIDSLQTALMVAQTNEKNVRRGIVKPVAPPVHVNPAEQRRLARKLSTRKTLMSLAVLAALSLLVWGVKSWSGDEKPPIEPAQNNFNDDPLISDSSGVEIGTLYHEARALQEKGSYEEAHNAFVGLRDNPKVQEPTRTWCGFEAMLSSFMDGKTHAAREDAQSLKDHFAEAGAPQNIGSRLKPWLDSMQGLPSIAKPIETDSPESDLVFLMSAVASGFKNWEQGKMAAAIPFFEIIHKAPARESDSLLGLYKKKAEEYLTDWNSLQTINMQNLPESAEVCREKTQALNQLHANLKTKGRAKFQIREWQLQLERHAKQLLEQKASTSNKSAGVGSQLEFQELVRDCRFGEAAELLKKAGPFADGVEEEQRGVLLAMSEAAGQFLKDLENDLTKSPLTVSLKSREGHAFHGITSAGEGRVVVKTTEGEISLPWSDFLVNDIITIYREDIKRYTNEADKSRRHEAAVSFQWLGGERDAAKQAAEILGGNSPDFKQRWTNWMKALKSL